MKHPKLTHNRLLFLLTNYFCSYMTLMYSNNLFHSHFTEASKPCYNIQDFTIGVSFEQKETHLLINRQSISEMLNKFAAARRTNYEDNLLKITMSNSHFLRTKCINSFFETINQYLLLKGKDTISKFHEYDWFRVLYVLRNSFSHADNITNKEIEFPDRNKKWKKSPDKNPIKPYPDIITYGLIRIKRGQTDHIECSDKDLVSMFNHILEFLGKNVD